MPSNTAIPAGTRRERVVEVVKSVLPRKKLIFQKNNYIYRFNIRFRPTFFFPPEIPVITALTAVAGCRERARE